MSIAARFCILAMLLSLLGGDARPGDKAASKSDNKAVPGIEVLLRFSVEQLDPLKPENSHVECMVRNDSPMPIQVLTILTNSFDCDLSLRAKGRHELHLVAWAGPRKQEFKTLDAGKEMTVLKALLKDVLLLEMTKDTPLMPGEKRYYWAWRA
jgi:hypothetical protein